MRPAPLRSLAVVSREGLSLALLRGGVWCPLLFVVAPAMILRYLTWIGCDCMQEGLTLALSEARPVVETLRDKVVSGVRVVRAVGMRLALAAALTLPAFAEDTGGGSSDLNTVISATDTITTMVGKAWDLTLSNPLTRTYVAGGLLATGIGFLVYLRRSSKH